MNIEWLEMTIYHPGISRTRENDTSLCQSHIFPAGAIVNAM